MITSPELSVLMTVFNGEKYVEKAIDSVLNQTFTNFEFIIINDGSTDKTEEIINSFKDERLHYYQYSENSGVSKQRKNLLNLANGTFLNFMDADDLIHPQKFEKQIRFLKTNPDISLLGTAIIRIDENGKQLTKLLLNAGSDSIPAIMLFRNYFVNSAVMFRKTALKNVSFDNSSDFVEDYLLWWQIIQKSKALNLPSFLTYYRDHPENMTHQVVEYRSKLDKRLYSIIFKDINLFPSEEELNLHYFISQSDHIESIQQMNNLFNWLMKISSHCKQNELSDYKRTIRNRWFKICFKARRNPKFVSYGLLLFILKLRLFFNK